jgi:hypothetical protein
MAEDALTTHTVVDCVRDGRPTGVAKPRFTGWTAFKAARERKAWLNC